jgi:hypothetical protein
MSSTAVPASRQSSTIRSSTSFCTRLSSAVVGSSAISSAGRSNITEAIMMRWRMPPEYSCG